MADPQERAVHLSANVGALCDAAARLVRQMPPYSLRRVPPPAPVPETRSLPALQPGRVLVVEDSIIIAIGTEENLNRLWVADALRLAGVRFVLATGYTEGAASFERFGAEAVLRKPYGMTGIEGLLAVR